VCHSSRDPGNCTFLRARPVKTTELRQSVASDVDAVRRTKRPRIDRRRRGLRNRWWRTSVPYGDRPNSPGPNRDYWDRPGRRQTVRSGPLSGIKMADCCVACLRHGSMDFHPHLVLSVTLSAAETVWCCGDGLRVSQCVTLWEPAHGFVAVVQQ